MLQKPGPGKYTAVVISYILAKYWSFIFLLVAISSEVWLYTLFPHHFSKMTPTCRIHMVTQQTVYRIWFLNALLFCHFPWQGACFRVITANKYKAQEDLSQLKQELSLLGKQKLIPEDRRRLKAAEVHKWSFPSWHTLFWSIGWKEAV